MAELVWIGLGWALASVASLALPVDRFVSRATLANALCWRNRLATAGFILAFLFVTVGLFPDPRIRAGYQYFFVITLGYGHLIGGASFAGARMRRMVPDGVPQGPFVALIVVSIAVTFVLYGAAVATSPAFFFVMLSISTWHIVENDLGMGQAYQNRLKIGPIPRSADHHWMALGATLLVAALSWAALPSSELGPVLQGSILEGVTNDGARLLVAGVGAVLLVRNRTSAAGGFGVGLLVASWLLPNRLDGLWWFGFSETFSAVILYHLVSWLVLFSDRSRQVLPGIRREASLWPRLGWLHLVPAVLCTSAYLHSGAELSTPVYWLLSPGIYLFWSVLHVLQTAAVRGLARPEPA